jgi:hypothetical protein
MTKIITERPVTPTLPIIKNKIRKMEFPPKTPTPEIKQEIPQIIARNNLNDPTTKKVKIFTSSISQNPALAFVDIQLSSPENRGDKTKCIHIKALDSGCTKTVIKHLAFEKLLEHSHIEIMQPEKRIVLILCTGESQPIEGSADIIMHFRGTNGINTAYQLNVLVHTALSQDFLLRRDFTGSNAKAFETNKHLHTL